MTTDLAPYREPGIVSENPRMIQCGIGVLVRAIPEPPPHWCEPPGFFKRLFNRIKDNDLWFCPCGKTMHMYRDYSDSWSKISEPSIIDEECARQGIERPYQQKNYDG